MAVPRLLKKYKETVVPELMRINNYKNPMQAPRIKKIVLNVGMGEAIADIKVLDTATAELAAITGQKAVVTRAKKSISNFKTKKGSPVGCKVTLRRERRYEFLDRLINVALPSLKDFRGVSPKGFDKSGNYSMGLTEQTIFPEIDFDKVQLVHGMDITIVTNAQSSEQAYQLLKLLGMPFKS